MPYQAPTGTHDILPGVAEANQSPDVRLFRSAKWQAVERAFRDTCARFGVEEIRTPLFEATELFKRSVGAETDIVAKETYDFSDRGGDPLTLRPEGTAPVVRAVVEHNLVGGQNQLLKVYYTGPIFRYERPQRGRYRQHHQVGIEYFGGDAPEVDVEVIALGLSYLQSIGLDDVELQLNSVGTPVSRPRHREALQAYLRPHLGALSEDSRRRFETNPLRILDSKHPEDQDLIAGAPVMLDYLEPEALEHFEAVQRGLANLGLSYTVKPRLVRGLDYYQKTAFEVVHAGLGGSQNVVLGGGRYDGLVQALGGPATPGIGFGSGIERALLLLEILGREIAPRRLPQAYLVARSEPERQLAQRLALRWRNAGLYVEHDLLGRSMKAQMRAANTSEAVYAVFVREDLLPTDQVALKRLADGAQIECEAETAGRIMQGEQPWPAAATE